MSDIGSLRSEIAAVFESTESRCLWWSGGSDSTLLLEIMLEQEKPFGILTFDAGWTKEQRRAINAVILERNLQVFRYPAVSNMLVAEGEEIGLVSQYAVNGFGDAAMLVRDLVHDDTRCAFDIVLEPARQKAAPVEFETHIWGLRRDDRHWAVPKMLDASERFIGGKRFLFPLADWTAAEVRAALNDEYGIDLSERPELGDINSCSRCLTTTDRVLCPKMGDEIQGVNWSPAGNLRLVRESVMYAKS